MTEKRILRPDRLRQREPFAHDGLHEVRLHREAADEHDAREPVQHRRLPLDERLVAQDERRTAEDDDDGEAHPLHVRDLLAAQQHPSDLQYRRGDGRTGRNEDVAQLESDEEQDDREEIEEELQRLKAAASN